ncbi:MAG: YbhB/YbcL family Raf kinase inhibitor-like protein [Syntrophomonadaceae bacterium]
MELTSAAFGDGGEIPKAHSRDGGDASPPLSWSGAPEGTKSFALVCDDPDAPRATPWVHWVLADLPASAAALPSARHGPSKEGIPGKNDFGEIGWGGPAPPRGHGTHHYQFRLYALDRKLGVDRGVTKDELLRAMKGRVLAEAQLTGTYRRD